MFNKRHKSAELLKETSHQEEFRYSLQIFYASHLFVLTFSNYHLNLQLVNKALCFPSSLGGSPLKMTFKQNEVVHFRLWAKVPIAKFTV